MQLYQTKFRFFTKGEIKPLGWMKRQLQIQADGLCGHLDQVWPDVRDSKWIGGNNDGWERVPYWLDGFIPMAYLLEDDKLIARAKRYVDGIIKQQAPDGWLCPCSAQERPHYDLWSGFLIAKVLVMYADLSGDPRIEDAAYRFMQNLWEFTRSHTLHDWALMRWFEALIPIFWLYKRRREDWLLHLALRLEQQGFDYEKLFRDYHDQQPKRIWSYSTHVVNLAMALKACALTARLHGTNPDDFAGKMLDILQQYHGMAVGHFTGDECVMGDSPVQGTELCGVVEAMYSYEHLLAAGGDPVWGDRLERLAYNALPAAISADMWTHQYDQQTNQIRCACLPQDHVVYGTNAADSNLFGLEPNFGCCTANFGQGWPKFASSVFMRTEDGIFSAVHAPAALKTTISGKSVLVRLDTEYPFRNVLKYSVVAKDPVEFTFKIRIPGFVKTASVNGVRAESGTIFNLRRVWHGEQTFEVVFGLDCVLAERPRDMRALWRGPLLFALPIREQWKKIEYIRNGVERKFPYCDYEVQPKSKWNYGFADDVFEIDEHEIGQFPFHCVNPPIEITARMAALDWPESYGICQIEPNSRMPVGEAQAMRLIPYGCARLRMTEMPLLA